MGCRRLSGKAGSLMIFINLLPDIKLEHLKMLRLRRVLVSLAIFVFVICAAICTFAYMLSERSLTVMEEKHEKNAQKTSSTIIKEDVAKILSLKYKVDIVKVLHDHKTDPERLFFGPEYLNKLVPEETSDYDNITINLVENTFVLSGATQTSKTAQTLEATIKYAGFENCTKANFYTRDYLFFIDSKAPLEFNASNDEIDALGTYSVSGKFASTLFDSQKAQDDLSLVIPTIIASGEFLTQPQAVCYANLDELVWDAKEGGRPPPQDNKADPNSQNEANVRSREWQI